MSFSTLKTQLQKEIKANPAKAGVLGVLGIVAVYFWVPLAWKMVAGKPKPAKKSSAVAASGRSSSPTPATEPASETNSEHPTPNLNWRQIVELIRKDPHTKTYPKIQNEHDPFQRVEKPAEVALDTLEDENVESQVVERDLSPAGLGMVLSSTVVGPRRSAALIGDRAYTVGQNVAAYDGEEKFLFRLIDIQEDRIVLSRDTEQYVLKMKPDVNAALVEEEAPGL